MLSALLRARRGLGHVSPNPLVGAALSFRDGTVVAAHHARFGGPHAEGGLLARFPGRLPKGSTLYVTLEPCAHQGKQPPCVDAVLKARPDRVVIATVDPFPAVRGASVARLRKAGIQVELGMGESAALSLNLGFHLWQRKRRAAVRLKLASSLDGRLAAHDGRSQWITGPAARRDVHRERAEADAVVVGASTVLADDPRLTVRDVAGPEPSKIVLDSALRTEPGGKLWKAHRVVLGTLGFQVETEQIEECRGNFVRTSTSPDGRWLRRPRLILATTARAPRRKLAHWQELGWEIWILPRDASGRVSLPALVRRAGREGLLRLLVEAGPALASAFFRARLVDELCLYLAPKVLGGPHDWSGSYLAPSLAAARRFEFLDQRRLGSDWKIELRREDWSKGLAL